MKKTLASLLASALVAAGMIATTAPTAMAATDCDVVGDGATLTGDIVVRPGVGCELNDVTVKGSLLLGPGSHVYLTGTQISGSVRNTRGVASRVMAVDVVVGGAFASNASTETYLTRSSVGSLTITGQGSAYVEATEVAASTSITTTGVALVYGNTFLNISCTSPSGLVLEGAENDVFGTASGACAGFKNRGMRWAQPSGRDGDWTGDGKADLVGVTLQGTQRFYTGASDGSLVYRGDSWSLTDLPDATWLGLAPDTDRDGWNDLFFRDAAGDLWFKAGSSNGYSHDPIHVGRGWGGLTLLTVAGDMNGDGIVDLVGRDNLNQLVRFSYTAQKGMYAKTVIGKNWGGVRFLVATGSSNGDRYADLSAITNDGLLFFYGSDAAGRLVTKKQTGRGWSGWNLVFSPGDFNGDGRRDLVGRSPEGILSTYLQKPNYAWTPRKQLGSGWNSIQLMA